MTGHWQRGRPFLSLASPDHAVLSPTLKQCCTALTAPTFPPGLFHSWKTYHIFCCLSKGTAWELWGFCCLCCLVSSLWVTESTAPRDTSARLAAFHGEMLLVEGMRKRFTDDDRVHLGTLLDNVTHVNGENGYQELSGW